MLVEESQVGPELLHLVKKKRMFLEDTDSAPEQIPEKQPVKVKARVVSVKQSEPLEDLGLTDDELALLEDLESEEN